jgi:hypothetical protein
MPVETHEFRVSFTRDELEKLVEAQCRVPQEFIEAEVTAEWTLGGATYPPGVEIIFTLPTNKEAP